MEIGKPGAVVTDVNGGQYTLDVCLGCGGQGEVWGCKDDSIHAVKLISNAAGSLENIRKVRRLRFNSDSFILPGLLLNRNCGYEGYIMEFLTDDMSPVKSVFPQNNYDDRENLCNGYFNSGSLGKRLKVLHNIAVQLYTLHSNGLIYRDISQNNIFVARNNAFSEICFIDCDNISFSDNKKNCPLTKPYAPPELERNQSSGSLTEVFSFAVLAFYILRGEYPFSGKLYTTLPEEQYRDRYKAGNLPYLDSNNHENCSVATYPIPHGYVFSKKLDDLFHATFDTDKGLNNPSLRPGIREWVDVLEKCLIAFLKCQNCGNDYFYNLQKCPWCDAPKKPFLEVKALFHSRKVEDYINEAFNNYNAIISPEGKQQLKKRLPLWQMCIQEGGSKCISSQLLNGRIASSDAINICFNDIQRIGIQNIGCDNLKSGTVKIPRGTSRSFPFGNGFALHFESGTEVSYDFEFRLKQEKENLNGNQY